jgi:hypothetical protein
LSGHRVFAAIENPAGGHRFVRLEFLQQLLDVLKLGDATSSRRRRAPDAFTNADYRPLVTAAGRTGLEIQFPPEPLRVSFS